MDFLKIERSPKIIWRCMSQIGIPGTRRSSHGVTAGGIGHSSKSTSDWVRLKPGRPAARGSRLANWPLAAPLAGELVRQPTKGGRCGDLPVEGKRMRACESPESWKSEKRRAVRILGQSRRGLWARTGVGRHGWGMEAELREEDELSPIPNKEPYNPVLHFPKPKRNFLLVLTKS
jgi:hypothetical protein